MVMTKEDKIINVYDSIRNLLYYFNKGNGINDLSDLHHDIFLKIYGKIDDIEHIKSYLYKYCYYEYQNWLKNKNLYYKNKVNINFDEILVYNPPPKVDFIQLHPISVDSRISVTFIDDKESFYPSSPVVAKELGIGKSAVNQWIRNGGVSWKTSKTLIIKEIKELDYIYNPFKNGIKVIKLLSYSTFEKNYKKGLTLVECNEKLMLFKNSINEGIIVKL